MTTVEAGSLLANAIHEAGHTIAAGEAGLIPPDDGVLVALYPNTSGEAVPGETWINDLPPSPTREQVVGYLAALLAGGMAESILLGIDGTHGAGNDQADVLEVVRTVGDGWEQVLQDAIGRARTLIERRRLAIITLAGVLLEVGALNRSQVEAVERAVSEHEAKQVRTVRMQPNAGTARKRAGVQRWHCTGTVRTVPTVKLKQWRCTEPVQVCRRAGTRPPPAIDPRIRHEGGGGV